MSHHCSRFQCARRKQPAVLGLVLVLAFPWGLSAQETQSYRVTFDATWSQQTHPVDFPGNPHFSGLIGGTHNANVEFWSPGGTSTEGIQLMAEFGGKSTLRSEVNDAIAAGHADQILDGRGIGNSPATIDLTFDVHQDFPLVTLVSMIAPSPDWFVGTHGLSLFEDGSWVHRVVYDLEAYDAGTDSGATYTSPNEVTSPREPIRRLTDDVPFLGRPALGTFTFVRLVDGDFDESGSRTSVDLDRISAAIQANDMDPTFDLNGDGTVTADDRTYWLRELENTDLGDWNLDQSFDSDDLIHALAAGEYEDDIPLNSGFGEGDANGDFEFTSDDLLDAFATGTYNTTPATAAVPEPSSAVLLALAVLCSGSRWRRAR